MGLASAIVAVALMPIAAIAQSSDAGYCSALAAKYEQYLDMSSKGGQQPQSLDARVAVEKCKAGDTSGISGIEKALKAARIDLPPRS
ncbi:MAG: hypothetical protein EPO10_23675 [Reyranella sp.]|uniref:hypothetical protein n=1 Tax=Reyranella sp. TaxID=1929291 RepID=UPI001203B9D8|nr:hypothetical protein [Reyranella sp.]TAJ92906.1 MAG: hypothetical protein EPO41_13435 [Reyranella sp.]TBR25849.1 MAG: hypothetical protein EPO10_23675 [Reyranella sp.]